MNNSIWHAFEMVILECQASEKKEEIVEINVMTLFFFFKMKMLFLKVLSVITIEILFLWDAAFSR